jgi:hypothetical protein
MFRANATWILGASTLALAVAWRRLLASPPAPAHTHKKGSPAAAQQLELVSQSMELIRALRDGYRGSATAASSAPNPMEDDERCTRNGRIRVRLLLDQLTTLQYSLLSLKVRSPTTFGRL